MSFSCMKMNFACKKKRNSMHEIEYFAQRIPCIELCTAQFPMKISGAKESSKGQNFVFHLRNYNVHACKCYAWQFHVTIFSCNTFFVPVNKKSARTRVHPWLIQRTWLVIETLFLQQHPLLYTFLTNLKLFVITKVIKYNFDTSNCVSSLEVNVEF